MTVNVTIEQLVELAKQAEYKNQIEWGEIPVNEDAVYESFALALYTAYQNATSGTRDLVLFASLIKVQVENFALTQLNKQLLHTISVLKNNGE